MQAGRALAFVRTLQELAERGFQAGRSAALPLPAGLWCRAGCRQLARRGIPPLPDVRRIPRGRWIIDRFAVRRPAAQDRSTSDEHESCAPHATRPDVVELIRHIYYSAVVFDVPDRVQLLSDTSRSSDSEGLRAVRGVFEDLGREDPMYAALSRNAYRGNRWDPAEFFETGRTEIADVMSYVTSFGLHLKPDRALDFGCALGRLTQALADHFGEVVGVDIASSMIERAREHNTHGSRVTYLVNTAPDLSQFESGTFDFIYTNKVLQHIPPEHQLGYIREFVRLLRPGGVAVFQTRNGPDIRPGTLRALLYTLNRTYFRRLAQRVRGRPAYEMHFVARSRVESAVTDAGGRVADVVDLSRGKPARSLRYCVTT